jgi:predicted ribosome quality control (RQC) complex YloA/Tae2 family protein
MKTVIVGKYNCKIGQNAKENWCILEKSNQSDIFFHLTHYPSCYVILETEDEKIENDIKENCALLCVENTKYKNIRNISVDYTEVSNVKKGEIVGEIEYKKKVKKIIINK